MADYAIYYLGVVVYKILRLLFAAIMVVHLFACVFWKVKIESAASPYDVKAFLDTHSVDPNDLSQIYLLCFYFIFTVFTTVGFGDITALSSGERIFCLFLFLSGASLFATLISQLNEIIQDLARSTQELDHKLGCYLSIEPKLSITELRKILGWVKFQFLASKQDMQHREVIDKDNLPKSLRRDVARKVENQLFSKILFLKDSNAIVDILSLFSAELFLKSKQLYFPEGCVIADSREIANGLMVITAGFVSVEVPLDSTQADNEQDKTQNVLLVLRKGDSFGDNVVVGDKRWGGSMGVRADFIAKSHCAVAFIKTEDIKEILKRFEFFPIACRIQLAELNSRVDLKDWNQTWDGSTSSAPDVLGDDADSDQRNAGEMDDSDETKPVVQKCIDCLGPKVVRFVVDNLKCNDAQVDNSRQQYQLQEASSQPGDRKSFEDSQARSLSAYCIVFHPDVHFKFITPEELKIAEEKVAKLSSLLEQTAGSILKKFGHKNGGVAGVSMKDFEPIVWYMSSTKSKSDKFWPRLQVPHGDVVLAEHSDTNNDFDLPSTSPISDFDKFSATEAAQWRCQRFIHEIVYALAGDSGSDVTDHKSKHMTKPAIVEFLTNVALVRLLPPTLTEEQKEQVLASCAIFDSNGDGMLDMKELLEVMDAIGMTNSLGLEKVIEDLKSQVGEFGDISFEKVVDCVRLLGFTENIRPSLTEQHESQIHEAFELFDTDGNETLHVSELKAALFALGFEESRVETAVTSLLERYDIDNSQELDINEFEEFMRSIALTNGGVIVQAMKAFDFIIGLGGAKSRARAAGEAGRCDLHITHDQLEEVCRMAGLTLSKEELKAMMGPFPLKRITRYSLYRIMRFTCWY